MMKKRRFAQAIVFFALFCLATPLYAATPWLHTEGNKIVDPAGNIVVLRGISLIDLGFLQDWEGGAINMIDRLTNKSDPCGSSPGWYPRIIRIPIAPPSVPPSNWPHQFSPDNNDLYNLLRTVVDYCKTKDMYAIIDWHHVANTYEHVASTSEFWTYMAPRFANDSHVMFELFNEPINNTGSDTANWASVKADMQTWIDIVRTYAPNNIILVGGASWSQTIGPAASNPLTGNNIVIVSHIYPGHWRAGNPSWYTNNVTTCAAVYPIMMTEWGFSQSGSPDPADLLNGTITGYGRPLSDFREQYQIGNTAWVASYDWGPPMFITTSWKLRIGEGEMGGFTKDLLFSLKDADQPGGGDTIAPAAPTGLAATVVGITVSLNWNDNSEIDLYGYNVYRSTTSGGPYTKINTLLLRNASYTDYNTVNYTTYYYVVKAVDTSFNSSGYSSQVSAHTTIDTVPPAAPTGLTATPGSGANSLNWNDNSDLDLVGYNVYRSTTSGGPYSKINVSLVSSSDYIDPNAVNLVTYYYVVTAVDAASNESYSSNEASAMPVDTTPPARPTGLTATIVGQTISLDWNDNTEPDLAGYNIYRGTSSGGPYSILNGSTLLTSSNYIDTTATAGITYYYVTRARDLIGNLSGNSNMAIILLPDTTPPAAPTGLTATAGSGTVSLDWNDNIEPDLAGYNVYRGTTSGGPYTKINGTIVSSSNYNDNSVTSGTTYYYVVRAIDTHSNESGNSNQASATCVDTTPPAAPTGLAATAGVSTVSLDWNNNAESDLAGYNVYRAMTSGGTYTRLNGTLLSSSNYTDNSVTNGTTYYYIVTAADNSSNESDNSSEVSATPYADTTPPAAPTGLTASAGDHTVALDWNNNSEGDLAGYNVYRSITSGSGYSKLNGAVLTSSNYTDNSAANGMTYYYVVRAADIYSNESANSSQVSATPQMYVGLLGSWATGTSHTKENGTNRALVFIAHAENNPAPALTSVTYGGQAMTRIIDINVGTSNRNFVAAFILNEAGVAAATSGTFVPTWSATPANLSYGSVFLSNANQTTLVGATARNSSNSSTPNPITTTALATGNGDMVIDAATCGNAGSYTLNSGFTETLDQAMPSSQGVIGYKSATGAAETPSATFVGTLNRQVIIGFVVKAMAADLPPAAPTGLVATAGIGSVSLDWNNNAEGDLAGYNIYRSITSGSGYAKLNSSLLTNSDYNDSNVSNGTTYYYAVTAVDAGTNESVYSGEVSATPGNPAATGTGAILCEWWSGISGTAVSDLTSNANYPNNPTGRELLTKLEGPTDWADNYGTRIRGFLIPPADGNYTFWIASDDASELWLSTDEQPGNASKIAYVSNWTNSREWNKETNQQSAQRSLLAGNKYYIEALQKEGTSGDNIAVAWQGPGISQQVIDGLYLSPCCLDFRDFAGLAEQWNRSDCNAGNNWCSGTDRDRDGNVGFDDLMAFAEEWLTGL